jgi:hypothetical protein
MEGGVLKIMMRKSEIEGFIRISLYFDKCYMRNQIRVNESNSQKILNLELERQRIE